MSAVDVTSAPIGAGPLPLAGLRVIEFTRIRGGKTFDTSTHWFDEMLKGIGQPRGQTVTAAHS